MPPHPPQKFQEPSVCRLIDASKPHLEFKSHSAEDADTVPEDFQSQSLLETSVSIKLEDQPSLHRALRDSRKQGKRPVRFADKPAHEFGISDRAYTFTGRWIGPPEKEMAEAGFYCTGKDKACCAYCEVEIRCWKESDGPWKKHQAFSPFCRHLKRCGLNASEISKKIMPNKRTRHNRTLLTHRQCVVCKQTEATVVFLPCSHTVTCPRCTDDIETCVICNQIILATCLTSHISLSAPAGSGCISVK